VFDKEKIEMKKNKTKQILYSILFNFVIFNFLFLITAAEIYAIVFIVFFRLCVSFSHISIEIYSSPFLFCLQYLVFGK
jgi:hypothetical protein